MTEFIVRDLRSSPTSRYKGVFEIRYDGLRFLDIPVFPTLPTSDREFTHVVKPEEENRLDVIAFIYYQDVSYFWILAQANQILNPLILPVGSVLRIPTFDVIFGEVGLL